MEDQPQFTSRYTSNFPAILEHLGISLVVSTYQAGRLIIIRAAEGKLNTHFRPFSSPMGIAYDSASEQLALGTRNALWEFHNNPSVAGGIEPVGKHDALFLPRQIHFSGDIRIHEIAYVDDTLWAVNTRFSCLCTFDRGHSFVPRWKPPFITGLAPEDRCHLNGMAVSDGRIQFLTCFGATDASGGWRVNKVDGGRVLAMGSGDTVLDGLCMPHSPRVRDGGLWLLESGRGSVLVANPATGERNEITRLPGFTRGLDFHGNLAFVGLSQVRESATFSGIPLVEESAERNCGVWVLDVNTGETVAFLAFDGIVREIFSVQVLPGIRYPELIVEDGAELDSSFILPDEAVRDVPGFPLLNPARD